MSQGNISLDHRGRVVIVTGAGQGLGRTVSLAFTPAGARVVADDVNPETVQSVAEQIREAGAEGLEMTADLGDAESSAWLAREAGVS
jgi:3-oxoacyl-[acyl-carrier protein] reductase